MTPVSYLQTDSRWAGISYSAKGESTTIGKAGCGPTCAAMCIATLRDSSVTPKETCAWSLKHGYKACKQGTYYTYLAPQLASYNIACGRVNTSNIYSKSTADAKSAHTKALNAIKAGKWVICCMGKGIWTSSGHYILWYGMSGSDTVMINDPNSTKSTRIRNKLKTLQSQVKYYWIVDTSTAQKAKEDDEVVEDRSVNIFGKEYTAKGIFKDGSNYLSPKVLKEAGLEVTSQGSTPIISTGSIKVQTEEGTKAISGFISNGTTYCGLRQLLELLGHSVDYDRSNETIIVK